MAPDRLSRSLFGAPSWTDDVQSGRDGMKPGDEVILLRSRGEWYKDASEKKEGWRSAPKKVGPDRPPQFLLYELEDQDEQEPRNYRVLWNPKDFVVEGKGTYHHRKKRTHW